jgi:hypothetical protein
LALLNYLQKHNYNFARHAVAHFCGYRVPWLANTTREEWEPVCQQVKDMLLADVHILMSPHQYEAFELLCCTVSDDGKTSPEMAHELDKVRESLFDKVRLEL